ncbi:hypothetical protein EG329_003894 [Mollisiaceae sp. DMI_Dod_QoI]|nr:hypothetical protein EG329_003894 [Helotiales sp. DMI_Dod_QoI]
MHDGCGRRRSVAREMDSDRIGSCALYRHLDFELVGITAIGPGYFQEMERPVLKAVLWMIIANGVVFYTITTVVHYGTYTNLKSFDRGSLIIEKIQMTVYCVQEFIISGLYVREVWRMSRIVTLAARKKRIMWELLVINLVIIGLDIALLCLEYLNLSVIEQTFKGLAYSFKLKMELAILGKLVEIAHANKARQPDFHGNGPPHSNEHSHVCSKPDTSHVMAA